MKNKLIPYDDKQIYMIYLFGSVMLMAVVLLFAYIGVDSIVAGDRSNIIGRSIDIYQTGNPFSAFDSSLNSPARLDPPLRYLPWVSAFAIFGTQQPDAIGYVTTLFFALVLIPLSVSLYVTRIGDYKIATYVLIISYFGIGISIFNLPIDDNWMYITPIPFMFGAIYAIDLSISNSSKFLPILAGFLAGIVGLQQLGLGLLMAKILCFTYIKRQRWVALAISGSVGAVFASYVPIYLDRYHATVAVEYLQFVPLNRIYVGFATVVWKDGLLFIICTLFLYYMKDYWRGESPVLTVTTVVTVASYFIYDIIFLSTWYSEVIAGFGQFVLIICVFVSIREYLPDISKPYIHGSMWIVLISSSIAVLRWVTVDVGGISLLDLG